LVALLGHQVHVSRACHRGLRVREPLRIRPMTSLNPVLTIGRQIAEMIAV
jgi:ABC-type dipeptide/oligopeptide/nickel transport system ATPase component